jgi:predicted Zn-dependent protease
MTNIRNIIRAGAGVGALLIITTSVFWSCGSLAGFTSWSAQVAGSLGLIDENTAGAISRSADAFSLAYEEMTPDQEYYIGRAVGANILSRYQIWNGNPALTKYLNQICNTIVINSSRPEIYNGYHVAILDTQEINAFATPGGHIFVTRGLIACTDSEDALAGVIAHEIGHILLRHSLEAIKNSRITQALLVTGGSVAGALDLTELANVMDESVNEIIITLVEKGFSRDQEFDADTAALALMASAGYEPSSLISMLRLLEKNQSSSGSGFTKTHPSPAQRLASAQQSVGKFKVPDTIAYRRDRYSRIR